MHVFWPKILICGGNRYSSFCAKFISTRQRNTDSFKPIFRAEGTSKRTFPLKTYTSFKHFKPSLRAHKLKHYWFSKYFTLAPKDNILVYFNQFVGSSKTNLSLETQHEFCRVQNTCSEEQRRESKEKTERCKNVWYKIR